MTSPSFADAQRQVLERQAQREAELRTRRARPLTSSPSTLLGRVSALSDPILSTIVSREGTYPPFRVSQVDAELLDEELLGLFKDQVGEALKYFSASLRDDYSSEILLALRAILFKLSIWDHNASYGATLQGLKYTDARSSSIVPSPPTRLQKVLYGLSTVFGRYAWEKWEAYLIGQSLSEDSYYLTPGRSSTRPVVDRLSRLSSVVSNTHGVAAFVSFLVFLVNGRYRTLTDRILRLRLVPSSSQVSREISFEYLNRQLVWHAFTEFLLFLLPLVGIGRWRKWVSRAWRKAKLAVKDSTRDDNQPEDADEAQTGPLAHLPERTCAICYSDQNPEATTKAELLGVNVGIGGNGGVIGSATTDIVNPYEGIPCGCIYCFVCLATKIEAEEGEGWTCLRCGDLIKQCRPWNGDVVESTSRSKMSSTQPRGIGSGDDHENNEDEQDSPLRNMEPKPEEPDTESTLRDSSHWSEVDRESPTSSITEETIGDRYVSDHNPGK